MTEIRIENDMREHVVEWLMSLGMECAHESMVTCCGYCDVIGFEFCTQVTRRIPRLNQVVSVELKLRDVTRVIYQAKINQPASTSSYAAMPQEFCDRMKTPTCQRFIDAGIGLLGVGNRCRIMISAKWNPQADIQANQKKWWRWHKKQVK